MPRDRRSCLWTRTAKHLRVPVALPLSAALVLFGSGVASAAPRTDQDPACQDHQEQCIDGHLVAPSGDSLDGHVSAAGSVGAAWPSGKLEADVSQRELLSHTGPVAAIDLAYGIGSWFTVGAWWQYGRFDSGLRCAGCVASTLSVGADFGYHPLAVERFDPFVVAGLGYRSTAIGNGVSPDITYSGFEWLRLQSGMDFYAFDHVGFGAFVELDAGNFLHKTSTPLPSTATHEQILVGARIVFDALGRL
jgi:hypothetical protein